LNSKNRKETMDSLIDENILVQPIKPNMIGTAVQNMFSFLQEEEK